LNDNYLVGLPVKSDGGVIVVVVFVVGFEKRKSRSLQWKVMVTENILILMFHVSTWSGRRTDEEG
jgi:hypothetical protein